MVAQETHLGGHVSFWARAELALKAGILSLRRLKTSLHTPITGLVPHNDQNGSDGSEWRMG